MPLPPLQRWDEIPLEKVTEMVARKTVVGTEHTLVQMYLKKGAIVPRHHHEDEQMIYVLQGALRVRIADEECTIREGDVLTVRPEAPHQAEALDDTFVMSVRGTGLFSTDSGA
jgi:quercetin dioxygenase-like cupin family protein